MTTTTIAASDLKQWIDEDKDFTLIDTLPANSYSLNHIPSAKHADVRGHDFVHQVEQKATDKNKPVVVYCMSQNCTLTPLAIEKLAKAGYKQILDYAGGLADWQDAGYQFEGTVTAKDATLACDCTDCGCD